MDDILHGRQPSRRQPKYQEINKTYFFSMNKSNLKDLKTFQTNFKRWKMTCMEEDLEIIKTCFLTFVGLI